MEQHVSSNFYDMHGDFKLAIHIRGKSYKNFYKQCVIFEVENDIGYIIIPPYTGPFKINGKKY